MIKGMVGMAWVVWFYGLTLPHFISHESIPAIVFALAIMAVTRESLRLRTAATAIV